MKVLVTRPRDQVQPLVDALVALGFDVVVKPLIRIERLSDEPIDVQGYECIIVTSPNGAWELARRMTGEPLLVAAIGPGTAAALEEAGIHADLTADVHTQEGLVAALAEPPRRSLFVGAEGARSQLAEQVGADFFPAYRTVELDIDKLPDADLVLLMSPSAASAYGRAGGRGPAVSIGPQTTSAARDAGVEVTAEAVAHDLAGLVAAVASLPAR